MEQDDTVNNEIVDPKKDLEQIGKFGAENNDFPIVGIGASAGGLEALRNLFEVMPGDTGAAFVVIQHLHPDHKSLMIELLAKVTNIPITHAVHKVTVKPNHIYLIPTNYLMIIENGQLLLRPRPPGLNLPINIFLSSLAKDQAQKAVAIILSGTGSDGSLGIQSIKENGGLIIAQDTNSAQFDGMPLGAINTKLVDYILTPDQMPAQLISYFKHPYLTAVIDENKVSKFESSLDTIYTILAKKYNVNFAFYKQTTILRRINRRMSVNQITHVADYLTYLQANNSELDLLFQDLLINVTNFFRDPEAFAILYNQIIPKLFASKPFHHQLRVWIAGCSTGEEAYSIAILLAEYMEEHNLHYQIKIFATDIDPVALETAGRGIYSAASIGKMPTEYIQKYFKEDNDFFEVSPALRSMIIFANHNIFNSAPFSKIDLVVCRNVLIYFNAVMQKRIISLFPFSLAPTNGFLFLGPSESIIDEYIFSTVHSKWRFYQINSTSYKQKKHTELPVFVPNLERNRQNAPKDTAIQSNELYKLAIELMLSPAIIVNEKLDLFEIFGNVNPYLQFPSTGKFSANVQKMAANQLGLALSGAIRAALKNNGKTVYTNVEVSRHNQISYVDLHVQFLPSNTTHKNVFVQFRPSLSSKELDVDTKEFDLNQSVRDRMGSLENELSRTRHNLQTTIEEMETSNEELQATNEELLASNEELQSTNEELQSVNEELITVNSEYQLKIQELTDLNDDIYNLFQNTETGILFLDENLNIRRFTPPVQLIIQLIPTDIGRSITHIAHTAVNWNLFEDASKVIRSSKEVSREIQTTDGRWYTVRLLPYRKSTHLISGIVIIFIDITESKQALEKIVNIVEQSPFANMLLDNDGKVIYLNNSLSDLINKQKEQLIGEPLAKLVEEPIDLEEVKEEINKNGIWLGELTYRGNDSFYKWAVFHITQIDNETYFCVSQPINRRQISKSAIDSLTAPLQKFVWASRINPVNILLFTAPNHLQKTLEETFRNIRLNYRLQFVENNQLTIDHLLAQQKDTCSFVLLPVKNEAVQAEGKRFWDVPWLATNPTIFIAESTQILAYCTDLPEKMKLSLIPYNSTMSFIDALNQSANQNTITILLMPQNSANEIQ